MKHLTIPLAYFFANIVALACVVSAAFLALHGIPGWGWFLFVGVLMCATVKSSKGSD